MPLGIGATPQSQLDALPLITAADAAAPSAYAIVGGKLSRYWNPAAAGVVAANFIADPDLAGASFMVSNYLDFTGMNQYVALLVATIPNAGTTDAAAVTLRIQYRTPTGAVQPRSGTVGQGLFTVVATRTPNYGLLGVYPTDYIVAYNWANSQGGVTMGSDSRLWFSRDAVVPKAGQLYNLHVWACQS